MISTKTVKSFEGLYDKGYDKEYPSIELVRIHKSIINNNFKKVLDFGSGHGANGIHFLKHNFKVTFCDISNNAIKQSKKKIKKIKEIKYSKCDFIHLKSYGQFRNKKYKKNFDLIICMSVINNLSSLKQIRSLINLFSGIMRHKGILILDTNYLNNNYPVLEKINKNTIITSVDKKRKNPFKMTFPKNKQQFINLIKQTNFKIKDVGNYSFKILNNFEKEDIFILENQ